MTTYYLPEARAADRLASLIEPRLSPAWLTRAALHAVCSKFVADRSSVRQILDQLDAGPTIGTPKVLLKQQQTASLDDQDWLLERLRELASETVICEEALRAMGSPYADKFDPDERDADREDDRLREVAQDERASREGVSL